MKLAEFKTLHCDAGWRVFSFLKLTTDNGIVGYSEYNESYGAKGLTSVIEALAERVMGDDALSHERVFARLQGITRQAPGGINAQAIAAIENALLDIKGKALEQPVYMLLGGRLRERLKLYWSHCGSYRLGNTARHMQAAPINTMDDLEALGAEVRDRGFSALKTNIFLFDDDPHMHMPGFAATTGWPELNASPELISRLREQLLAIRAGAGPNVNIHLDLNFNFKTEGFLQVARGLDDLGLAWFEIDSYDPAALAYIRRSLTTSVASCESLFGTRGFKPFLENYAVDVAIIDVPWNGIWQSMKIAAMAEAYEINVAPHNFYGHLCTLMSAHFCTAIPNFRIMEIDIDDVPWKDALVTQVPKIEDGHLILPEGPGWGADVVEDVVAAHPPKQ